MMATRFLLVAAMALCACIEASAQADAAVRAKAQAQDTDPIADYLADLSAGAVSASEMLGLSASAISTLRSPKDFVVALNALSAGAGKQGFGLSFTPGRTRFAPVSIASYSGGNVGARLWAGTTLSYAQNTNTRDSIDYTQDALALHLSYYLNAEDDPALAARKGFVGCTSAMKKGEAAALRVNAIFSAMLKAGIDPESADVLATARFAKEMAFAKEVTPEINACINWATAEAKAKWNASQVGLTLGQGWIQNPAANSPRLSLGQTISLAGAIGPNSDSLVNLTVRHVRKAIDTDTLAATIPNFKNSTLVGARWTYRAIDSQDLFAIAEISNAKGSSTGMSNNVFKSAFGVDKRLSEGMWLELRLGRNRTADGKGEQTAALMSLKLAPTSSLPR